MLFIRKSLKLNSEVEKKSISSWYVVTFRPYATTKTCNVWPYRTSIDSSANFASRYYTGEKQAPVLTVVIGGNHEASNYFWELYHGGWLAPNIYFLGHAGCIQVNGIRIAGASGIFKPQDFRLGHWERVPYDHGSMRSIYHVREFNVRRLSLLSSPTIFLSHDWPQSIEHHGNLRDLLRRKPYFRDDINKGALGSPPMMNLLRTLQPDWWFSAHLHCRFEAVVSHEARPSSDHAINMNPAKGSDPDEIAIVDDSFTETKPAASSDALMRQGEGSQSKKANETTPVPLNPDEIMLDDDLDDVEAPPPPPPPPKQTRFIALDKCLPKRQFLEVIDVAEPAGLEHERDNDSIPTVTFDPEWLAISRAFHPYMSLSRSQRPYPDEAEARESVKKEMEWIKSHILAGKGVKVNDYQTFVVTAPPPGADIAHEKQQPPHYPNPQTQAFCSMLEIENKIDPPSAQTVASS